MKQTFIAHNKGTSDHRRALALRLATEKFPGSNPILGFDDFNQSAHLRGGWSGWPESIATRKVYGKGGLQFGQVVVTDARVGRATASTVEKCLETGMPVWLMSDDGDELFRVMRVLEINPRDFKAGWEIRLDESEF